MLNMVLPTLRKMEKDCLDKDLIALAKKELHELRKKDPQLAIQIEADFQGGGTRFWRQSLLLELAARTDKGDRWLVHQPGCAQLLLHMGDAQGG